MKNKKIYIIPGVAVIVLVIGFVMLGQTTRNKENTRIYIPRNCDYRAVCDTLQKYSCMPNRLVFNTIANLRHYDEHIKSGSYIIPPKTGCLALFRKLNGGCQDPIKLTLGKYRTKEQLCHYLASVIESSEDSLLAQISNDSLMAYFIPNTYEVYWNITPKKLQERMVKEWDAFWNESRTHKAQQEGLTPYQVMVLASIVEEETNKNEDKPIIASVYLNRLRKGMLLQADPTVKYAVGDFTLRRILTQHTMTDSPYNTYRYKGLPPAPICTPSVSSIDAVLADRHTDYLYFCAKDDFSGYHAFASTLAQHNENARRFHNALNLKGVYR